MTETEERSQSLTLKRKKQVSIELEEKSKQAKSWIESVLGENIQGDNFVEVIRDGVFLCRTIKAINPELIGEIHESSSTNYKSLDNMLNRLFIDII